MTALRQTILSNNLSVKALVEAIATVTLDRYLVLVKGTRCSLTAHKNDSEVIKNVSMYSNIFKISALKISTDPEFFFKKVPLMDFPTKASLKILKSIVAKRY